MKCVTLADNLVPEDPNKVRYGSEKPAKLLIQEHVKRSKGLRAEFTAEFGSSSHPIGKKQVATLGSEEIVDRSEDDGFFSSVLTAYNYHWNLRTSPDDWWFCVIRRVALAIDKNANKDSVRKVFVNHAGKKTLEIAVDSSNIYDVNYSQFFDEMSEKISENVHVPEYVEAVTADFSGTTATQKIVSQITLMSSLHHYFDYSMYITLCGIPAVEMLGTEEDWKRLQSKLEVLRRNLEPIMKDIKLTAEWWNYVENVFKKLEATYKGSPDKDWWSRIVSFRSFGSGDTGNPYSGWITKFMIGVNASRGDQFSSGLVSVPLNIRDSSGAQDTATLAAGIASYTVHEDGENGVPSVQPFHGWCLSLPGDSPFLKKSSRK